MSRDMTKNYEMLQFMLWMRKKIMSLSFWKNGMKSITEKSILLKLNMLPKY